MADDSTPDLAKTDDRPDQADDHHDAPDHGHDDHGDHPVEDPRWVLAPIALGLVLGVIVVIVLGLNSGANPFNAL